MNCRRNEVDSGGGRKDEIEMPRPRGGVTNYRFTLRNIPDRVRNEEILHKVKEERNIVHTIKGNCLLKHVIEGKLEGRIEMTGRRGIRSKQLLDDLKGKRRYWKLKEEALDRTQWRTRFGKGCGPVVRQTTE
jgi:hypothetical protein